MILLLMVPSLLILQRKMKKPCTQVAVWAAPLRHAAETAELGKELDTQE